MKYLILILLTAGVALGGTVRVLDTMTTNLGPSTIVKMRFELLGAAEDVHVLGFDVHYRYGGSPVTYNP